MNSNRCKHCGLISWVTVETCRRCGAALRNANAEPLPASAEGVVSRVSDQFQVEDFAPRTSVGWLRDGLKRPFGILLLVLVLISVVLVAKTSHGSGQPKTFLLKDGSMRTSAAWFNGWFSSDPSVDDIFAQYLKVSGWHEHASALKNFVARGKFQLKNDAPETIGITQDGYRHVVHIHWNTSEGELELESEGPGKLVITQKFEERNRVFQRGTNGEKGWWRKGYAENASDVGPSIRLVNTVNSDEIRGDSLTDLKRGADFVNYFQLQNTYPTVYLGGKTLVGERVAYEVVNRNGVSEAVTAMYFDVETGMLLRFDSYRHGETYNPVMDGYTPYSNSPAEDAETYLEDYRELNGLKIPFRIRQKFRDLWITTTITDFKANTTLDEAVFERPS